jgi:thiol-disulfide isomerase/thioredoxin
MFLTKKDKSFLLLIATVLAILWIIFSVFINISNEKNFKNSDLHKIDQLSNNWLNVSRPLTGEDLKNRIVIINFWTYSCFSCLDVVAKLNALQEKYPQNLVIISVHNSQFDIQTTDKNIRKIIARNNISYPIVNDNKKMLANSFDIKQLPTLILFDNKGRRISDAVGLDKTANFIKEAEELLHQNRFGLNKQKLPLTLEKDRLITNVLTYPTKIIQVNKIKLKDRQFAGFIIANSGQNNIIVSTLAGDIVAKIGSGKQSFRDGDFVTASFYNPQGMLYNASNNTLLIADTGNHAIRSVDLNTEQVTTILGNSFQGEEILANTQASGSSLSSPLDMVFFPNQATIAFNNSGTKQIILFDIANNILQPLQLNTKPDASALATFRDKLYFFSDNLLYSVDKNLNSQQVYGKNNLLTNPRGLAIDDTGIYISNTFKHSLLKLNWQSNELQTLINQGGGGDDIGNKTTLDEPYSILLGIDRFYVADANNNRIVSINRTNLNSELLNIMPPLKLPKETFLEYLPNLENIKTMEVQQDAKLELKIVANKGWKINQMAPSFINIIELDADKANLIASFNWNDIKLDKMLIDVGEKDLFLQGKIYFCQDTANALCYIKSYQQKIKPSKQSNVRQIKIQVGK